MTEIYCNFGIELYDRKIEGQVHAIMQILGEVDVRHTRRDTVIFNYNTPLIATPYVNEVSDILCDKLEPFASIFGDFYQGNKEKCYMGLCFVISELGDEGISIFINQRLIKLAMELGVEIQFDGL